jgi:hypothetical protein
MVVKAGVLGQNGLRRLPWFRDISLFFAQIIDELSDRLLRLDLKKGLARTADGDHPQILV